MGNVSSLARASTGLDSYVAELGNDLSYDRSLSSSRFLKTILARHGKGPLVLKIFIKPDPGMSLRVIQRRLKIERDTLVDLPNIHPSQAFVETDKAGYLIRQWGRYNLYDRISTQPYLANVEKTWIAFQLLTGLRDARSRKIAHGDVKSENILITSDLTVLITDFSTSFKPTFLPLDDPSDFSFFFDTSGRRTCYLAPERFFSAESQIARAREERDKDADQWGKRDGKVTEAMDVFSAGCVLLEMWTEGRGVFSLSDLYAYRDGMLTLDTLLEGLADSAVKSMIHLMLSLDPDQRPSFDRILTSYRGTVFPEYFYTFFADYCLSLAETAKEVDEPSADHAIRRLTEEWDSIKVYLTEDVSETPLRQSTSVDEAGPGLLLLNLVASNIRNCVWPTSRLRSLELLKNLSAFLTDEDVINRAVPFALAVLTDEQPNVRGAACQTLVEMISAITSITPQNAHFISEYVLPALKVLTSDPDVNVRCIYARNLVRLATKAVEILEMAVALRSHSGENSTAVDEADYDNLLQVITDLVEDHASELLIDASSQVKRVMLSTVTDLCLFFGRRKSNEFILSHIMTYLNDRDWALRFAFFEAIVGVGAFLGHVSIEEYVLPLMMQALADPEEYVTVRVIASLASFASVGLFPRGRLWDLCHTLRPYLVHPNAWIRCGVAGFLGAAAQNLPTTDVWCILYPSIRPLLKADLTVLDASSILNALRSPMSRTTYRSAQLWSVQDPSASFWSKPSQSVMQGGKVSMLKSALKSRSIISPAAEAYLLHKGLPGLEVENVALLRDLIIKQAMASQSRSTLDNDELEKAFTEPSISLTSLGVTPITVFINQRVVDMDPTRQAMRKMGRLSSVAGTTSRRSSFASRTKSDTNPLEEIRKRLAHMEPKSEPQGDAASDADAGLETILPQTEAVRTPSTSADIAPLSAMGKRGVSDSVKAVAAVGAVHANAHGTVDSARRDAGYGPSTNPASSNNLARASSQASYTSTYEGRDPGVKNLLDQVDLENYREPLINFGPRVSSSSTKRRPARAGVPRSTSADRTSTMIAHLTHHTACITCLATSPDHTFFASGSSDSAVSIWDTARLERSVSAKPRLTYRGLVAPVTALCSIEASHCLAIGSADGQMHIVRVHVATGSGSPKYSRVECLQTWSAPSPDGAIIAVSHGIDLTTLIVVTASGLIGILDMRTWTLRKELQQPVQYGPITCSCLDKSAKWIIVGSASGRLALWDLRFGILIRSWSVGAPVLSIRHHPSRGRGRWIMVSVKSAMVDNAVEVHDIDTATVMERYRTGALARDSTLLRDSSLQDPSLSDAIAALASPRDPTLAAGSAAALALFTGEGFAANVRSGDGSTPLSPVIEGQINPTTSIATPGYMIAAGEDRTVRFWDVGNVADSFIICGSARDRDAVFSQAILTSGTTEFAAEPPKISQRSSAINRSRLSRVTDTEQRAQRSQALVQQGKQPLRPHYDAISVIGTLETPYSSCVITGDRSGVIKVWRIEGASSGA